LLKGAGILSSNPQTNAISAKVVFKSITAASVLLWALFAHPAIACAGQGSRGQSLTASLKPLIFGFDRPAALMADVLRAVPPKRPPAFVLTEPPPVSTLPIILDDTAHRYVTEFVRQRAGLRLCFERSRPYLPEMTRIMQDHGLPTDLVYLSFAESEFAQDGAGPWQFTEATARRFGLHINEYVDERRDPILATRAAARYLATIHRIAGRDWRATLVGWNVGEGAIRRYWPVHSKHTDLSTRLLPSPTRGLLGRFMAVTFIARNAPGYASGSVDGKNSPSYCTARVKGGTTLARIARMNNTTVSRLRELNPALLRDIVPPYESSYPVRLPVSHRGGGASVSGY